MCALQMFALTTSDMVSLLYRVCKSLPVVSYIGFVTEHYYVFAKENFVLMSFNTGNKMRKS